MLIEFYKEKDGVSQVLEFLENANVKVRAKLIRTIRLLEMGGFSLRMPYSEYLGNDILELRARIGTDRYRILYFFYKGDKAVLTNCFLKTTRKTPVEELNKAIKNRNIYFSMH